MCGGVGSQVPAVLPGIRFARDSYSTPLLSHFLEVIDWLQRRVQLKPRECVLSIAKVFGLQWACLKLINCRVRKETADTSCVVIFQFFFFLKLGILTLTQEAASPYSMQNRLLPWRWRQRVYPKRWYLYTKLRDVTSQETEIVISVLPYVTSGVRLNNY